LRHITRFYCMNSLLVTEQHQRPSAALLPQNPWKRRKVKTSHIKYGLFFFMIFMMITAVKVYLNYANINQNIIDVKAKIVQRQKDMLYLEIQNEYYRSPYAYKLTAHQQGNLLEWEQFILFEHIDPTKQTAALTWSAGTWHTGSASTENSLTPSASWRQFFEQKIDSIP